MQDFATKALQWLARIAVGKQLVQALAWIHTKADGHRTELILAAWALVHGLKIAGVIPASAADSMETAFKTLLPLTLADKASKVYAEIDGFIPQDKPNAPAQP